MDIRDFRCCSYVQHCIDGLTRIELGDFELIHDGSHSISEYSGIPITKEWIERFGFRESNSICVGNLENGYENEELLIDSSLYPTISTNDGCFRFGKKIEFVHQLQNLYYILTGKELELNK